MNAEELLIYITTWCGDCRRVLTYLDAHGVAYHSINIDSDPEAARLVRQLNNGFRSVPTLIFPNGRVLVEPDLNQLQKALSQEHSVASPPDAQIPDDLD